MELFLAFYRSPLTAFNNLFYRLSNLKIFNHGCLEFFIDVTPINAKFNYLTPFLKNVILI